ncbi:MAG: single-stranded DNA-binding protein [Clostridia bacterium]|nr:single-stranded DNA-binding protein [Clostridia bacterium]
MNKIFLIGNLTADPDYSVSASGVPVCRFSIAVNRRFSGNNEERTADFFRITTFRKTAENCASFLAKGRKVGITGSIQINDYTDKEGNRRQSVDVTADEVEFLSPKGEGDSAPAPRKATSTLEPVTDDSLPF